MKDILAKHKRKRCWSLAIILTLILSGSCLLSVLLHQRLDQMKSQSHSAAEVCVGGFLSEQHFGPIMRQGLWIASPFLVSEMVGTANYRIVKKSVCGVIPWFSNRIYFRMLVMRPQLEIYPK